MKTAKQILKYLEIIFMIFDILVTIQLTDITIHTQQINNDIGIKEDQLNWDKEYSDIVLNDINDYKNIGDSPKKISLLKR